MVAKPQLYIRGQSGSSDSDQMMYIDTRLSDLSSLHQTLTTSADRQFSDELRFVTGDNLARHFESGQQKGGHYSYLCGAFAPATCSIAFTRTP
jgi:hypothetical protein